MTEKISIQISNDVIIWKRGGQGLSVAELIAQRPCLALKYMTSGSFDDLHEAILSQMKGRAGLMNFSKLHPECEADEGVLGQV